ncbi:unnamed protein product [Lymnaea stagnalis]|uniref:Phosphatidylinositol-specific phospholipase C X domain-containing protein n=1 Tax=Lymnaea stagnalis TaxID=6523 RepID=A0AAV2IA80_LYMST
MTLEEGKQPNIEWMTSLGSYSPTLLDLPLTKLAIPGSHNSGTFNLDASGGLSPGTSADVINLVNNPTVGPLAKGVVHRWSVCQSLDFIKQLNAGVRYFDLRVATKDASEDLYFVHQLFGLKVTELTESIVKFLQEHPHEVIFLDFNHFYSMELEHHIQLITHLIYVFGPKICHRRDPDSLTLNKMWEEEKQVIIFYQDAAGEDFLETFTTASLSAPWPNTPETSKSIQFLTSLHEHRCSKGFLVSQGVLTPTMTTIMAGLFSTLETWNRQWTPVFCSWIKERSAKFIQPLNIVITDFVENDDFVQTVIDLNKSRTDLPTF